MPDPIVASLLGVDMSSRLVASTTVVASPSGTAETIVASVTVNDEPSVVSGIIVVGWVAYTVAGSGASVTLRLRQTAVNGTQVASSGATTATATNLDAKSVYGFDTSPAAGRVYKLTMAVGSGSGSSAVSAVFLGAIAI